MNKNHPRRAFTLTELLVVIAIIALAVTLLLPATRRTGSAGLKNSCRNNMKQLALALQNHNDTFKTFPPLYFRNNSTDKAAPELNPANAAEYYSWNTRVLPFIEEDTLYKNISKSSNKFVLPSPAINVTTVQGSTTAPGSPATIRMGQLICPSNPLDMDLNPSNYAALPSTRLPLLLHETTDKDGLPVYQQEPDGMLIPDRTLRGQSMARMKDGTSRTAVLIESNEATRANWYRPQESFVVGFPPADSTPIDAAASNYYPYFGPKQGNAPQRTDWQFNPTAGNRTALSTHNNNGPAVPYHPVKGDPLERTWGPSSAHHGGIIIVGMGDGSVQEITPEIDPAIFFAAITARGAEAVQPLGSQN